MQQKTKIRAKVQLRHLHLHSSAIPHIIDYMLYYIHNTTATYVPVHFFLRLASPHRRLHLLLHSLPSLFALRLVDKDTGCLQNASGESVAFLDGLCLFELHTSPDTAQ